MNWTGGARARNSKATNDVKHKQKQFFAKVRAQRMMAVYGSSASSNAEQNSDDPESGFFQRRKQRKVQHLPEFEVVASKEGMKRSEEGAEMERRSPELEMSTPVLGNPSRRVLKTDARSRKAQLLLADDWVCTSVAAPLKQKTGLEASKQGRTALHRERAYTSEQGPQSDPEPLSPPWVPPPVTASQTVTEVPSEILAHHGTGFGAFQRLNQGGYVRIGNPAGQQSLTSISEYPDENTSSQDTMLFDLMEEEVQQSPDGSVRYDSLPPVQRRHPSPRTEVETYRPIRGPRASTLAVANLSDPFQLTERFQRQASSGPSHIRHVEELDRAIEFFSSDISMASSPPLPPTQHRNESELSFEDILNGIDHAVSKEGKEQQIRSCSPSSPTRSHYVSAAIMTDVNTSDGDGSVNTGRVDWEADIRTILESSRADTKYASCDAGMNSAVHARRQVAQTLSPEVDDDIAWRYFVKPPIKELIESKRASENATKATRSDNQHCGHQHLRENISSDEAINQSRSTIPPKSPPLVSTAVQNPSSGDTDKVWNNFIHGHAAEALPLPEKPSASNPSKIKFTEDESKAWRDFVLGSSALEASDGEEEEYDSPRKLDAKMFTALTETQAASSPIRRIGGWEYTALTETDAVGLVSEASNWAQATESDDAGMSMIGTIGSTRYGRGNDSSGGNIRNEVGDSSLPGSERTRFGVADTAASMVVNPSSAG